MSARTLQVSEFSVNGPHPKRPKNGAAIIVTRASDFHYVACVFESGKEITAITITEESAEVAITALIEGLSQYMKTNSVVIEVCTSKPQAVLDILAKLKTLDPAWALFQPVAAE